MLPDRSAPWEHPQLDDQLSAASSGADAVRLARSLRETRKLFIPPKADQKLAAWSAQSVALQNKHIRDLRNLQNTEEGAEVALSGLVRTIHAHPLLNNGGSVAPGALKAADAARKRDEEHKSQIAAALASSKDPANDNDPEQPEQNPPSPGIGIAALALAGISVVLKLVKSIGRGFSRFLSTTVRQIRSLFKPAVPGPTAPGGTPVPGTPIRGTAALRAAAGIGLKRAFGPLGIILTALVTWQDMVELYYAWQTAKTIDGREFAARTIVVLTTGFGGVAGGLVLSAVLSSLGAIAGIVVPGAGSLILGLAGGIIGYAAGEYIAGYVAKCLVNYFLMGTKEPTKGAGAKSRDGTPLPGDYRGDTKDPALPSGGVGGEIYNPPLQPGSPLGSGSEYPRRRPGQDVGLIERAKRAVHAMMPFLSPEGGGSVQGGGADMPVGAGAGSSANATTALNYFVSQGWTRAQAAGIVGNLQAESGRNLNPSAVGDSGKAIGIAQWHADRRANFQRAVGKPFNKGTFQDQLHFVQWELQHTETRAAQMLRTATTAGQAASIMDKFYERSSGAVRGQRVANAIALDKAAGGTQVASATPPSRSSPSPPSPRSSPPAPSNAPKPTAVQKEVQVAAQRQSSASHRGSESNVIIVKGGAASVAGGGGSQMASTGGHSSQAGDIVRMGTVMMKG